MPGGVAIGTGAVNPLEHLTGRILFRERAYLIAVGSVALGDACV